MSDKLRIHIGGPEDMGRRFVDAWKRAEAGEAVDESHITFLDLGTLLSTLTPKRLTLLRHVRQHPSANVRALATALKRDYKNVHRDVDALTKLGLLSRDAGGVAAPFAELEAKLAL
jgi:predicted transcriptional regulator